MEFSERPWSANHRRVRAEKGTEITAALGQQGDRSCGSGGSFLVLESDEGPKPLLIAGEQDSQTMVMKNSDAVTSNKPPKDMEMSALLTYL